MPDITYSPAAAVAYARKYAQAPRHMRPFYTAPDDCTNFVSQCIWAGFGGYSDDLAKTRERIRRRYRMARGLWHGDDGGGTPAWETVERLYAFCTAKPGQGPKGTGANDGGMYALLPAESLRPGDIVQLRGESGPYRHSAIVSGRRESGMLSGFSPYDGILVCQHSRDARDRNLWDLIVYFGGPGCHMRLLRPVTGSFPE